MKEMRKPMMKTVSVGKKWKPIKTAPKDRPILLAVPSEDDKERFWLFGEGLWVDYVSNKEYYKEFEQDPEFDIDKIRLKKETGWLVVYITLGQHWYNGKSCNTYNVKEKFVKPTHWMDLPKKPTKVPTGYWNEYLDGER